MLVSLSDAQFLVPMPMAAHTFLKPNEETLVVVKLEGDAMLFG